MARRSGCRRNPRGDDRHRRSSRGVARLKRLARYADVYRDMAEVMLARGDGDDGKVWIFEKDVLELRAKQRPRDFNGRRKLSSLSIEAHR